MGETKWKSLRIGDQVRLVTWPLDLHRDCCHPDTVAFYDWLIETQSVLTVETIDELGMPWGEICREIDGVKQLERILLNHGGLEVA